MQNTLLYKMLCGLLAMLVAVLFAGPVPRIAAEEDPSEEGPFMVIVQITGTVETVAPTMIEVDGVIVLMVDIVLPEEPEVSDLVHVVAYLLEDGTLQAIWVSIIPDVGGAGTVGGLDLSEEEEEEEEEPAEVELCARDDHPIALALAAEFEVDYDTVIGWHCDDGFGFGEIARALLIAEQTDYSAEELLALMGDGMSWGQVFRETGLFPANLSLGYVISGRYRAAKDAEEGEEGEEVEAAGLFGPPGLSGGGPPGLSGGGPPGLSGGGPPGLSGGGPPGLGDGGPPGLSGGRPG